MENTGRKALGLARIIIVAARVIASKAEEAIEGVQQAVADLSKDGQDPPQDTKRE